jgi:hypothetical protein
MQWANKLFGMGLLDPDLEKRLSEAQRRQMGSGALMDAGLAMLANSGYSRMPTSTGQALAAGLGAGRASYAGQAQGLQEQMAAQQQAQAEEQQRAAILQGLPPELQGFARGLGMNQLMDVAKGAANEKSKAMNREAPTSSYAKAARDILGPGSEGTPEFRALVERLATQSKAPVVNVNTGAPQFKVGPLSPEEAQTEGLPVDRRWQRLKDGRVQQIAGTEPSAADADRAAKIPQVYNAGMLMEQMQSSIDGGLTTGPWNELFNIPIGRWSSQEKEQFEGLKEQLSTQIRAVFRIKGEGPLSDQEQRQYGLTMPSLDKRPETNTRLISNLQAMMANAIGSQPQIVPNSSAAQGGWKIVGVE